MLIRAKTPSLQAFRVDLNYPAWDELHNMIPRKWFYGGLFFDKSGDFQIIENGDVIINDDENWFLLKPQEFDKLYEIIEQYMK